MNCHKCGGAIKPRMEKFKTVAGTTAAVTAFGFALGTPIGWMALLSAASSPEVMKMLRLKCHALQLNESAGAYFECASCGRDIGWGEALGF
jgi:hypothetical protein